jgi:gamma-glutamyltranspeptidase/glutathione hydrolase
MAPTLVLRDGHVFLVLGSPGGARIITITLEAALNILDYNMAPQEAVDAPRLHHQWLPDEIFAEPFALSPDTQALLQAMGYRITEQTPWGATELIEVAPPQVAGEHAASSGNDAAASGTLRPGWYYGANDARRPAGAAIGY